MTVLLVHLYFSLAAVTLAGSEKQYPFAITLCKAATALYRGFPFLCSAPIQPHPYYHVAGRHMRVGPGQYAVISSVHFLLVFPA